MSNDQFFKQKHCSRCGQFMTGRIMSMFSEEPICLACKDKEENHPDYAAAREVENNEVLKGNYNYKGVGSPFEVKFEDAPDYADVFTLKDFIECCKMGGFNDYDGSGCYGVEGAESNIPVDCSELAAGIVDSKFPWTHVFWYNK